MEENKVETGAPKDRKFSKRKIAKYCLIAAIGIFLAIYPVFSSFYA